MRKIKSNEQYVVVCNRCNRKRYYRPADSNPLNKTVRCFKCNKTFVVHSSRQSNISKIVPYPNQMQSIQYA